MIALGSEAAAPLADCLTFVILNYNGERDLPRALQGLLDLGTGCRIVVIDDGSTDGSVSMVKAGFPGVEVIEAGPNTGRIGRIRKLAVEVCNTRYLMLMDNDVVFAPDTIPRLLRHLQDNPRAMSCRPRLVYARQPNVIYQDANTMHYLALAGDQRRGRPVEEGLSPVPRGTIGGGIMLLDCAIVRRVGNFDENYLFGWSDGELDVRARLLGFETLHDPFAIGYHVDRRGGLRRVVGQLYNRRRLILICYSARSLAVLGPALLAFELILLAMCMASGYWAQYREALTMLRMDAADIHARRRAVQAARRRDDGAVLSNGRISIAGRMERSRAVLGLAPVLSIFFSLYWRIAAPLAGLGRNRESRVSTLARPAG